MIRETIVTTQSQTGETHIAPMGIRENKNQLVVQPFRPSTTLENILESKTAVINYTDDVRVFAGSLTGHKEWPLKNAEIIKGKILGNALAHVEVELARIEQDKQRPKLFLNIVHQQNHSPFCGFNRAQFSVIEAAVLVSRLNRLPWQKIQSEIEYLKIGFEKTAGEREREAWKWLMHAVDQFKIQHPEKVVGL